MKPPQKKERLQQISLAPSHRHFLCRISVPVPSGRLHQAGAGHDTLLNTRKSRKAAGHAGKRSGPECGPSRGLLALSASGTRAAGAMSHRQNSKMENRGGRGGQAVTSHPPHP